MRAEVGRQRLERDRQLAAGKDWVDTGYVFVRADGTPIHPTYLTQRMRTLVKRAGLPPIRLHDTYTSVLPRSQRRAAKATARLVLAAARKDRRKIKRNARKTRPVAPKKSAAPGMFRQEQQARDRSSQTSSRHN